MVTYDPIFEQNYRKKVDAIAQDAYLQGRSQGVMDILNIIQHFNENEMPVTPKTIIMFMQQMEVKRAEPQPAPPNHCNEIELEGSQQTCVLEPPPVEEKKRPKLEIV